MVSVMMQGLYRVWRAAGVRDVFRKWWGWPRVGVDSHTANVLVLNALRFVSEFACQHFG